MKNIKSNKAITLIALVITIVVLIILAGVLINISLGNNGLFNKAKTAKEMYVNSQNYEETEIAKMTNNIDSYVDGNRETKYMVPFVDTSNLIQEIANDSGWQETKVTWTATQDCYILGRIGEYDGGNTTIKINDVQIGQVGYWDLSGGYFSINYMLKKGDKIEFESTGGSKSSKKINAYGIKY